MLRSEAPRRLAEVLMRFALMFSHTNVSELIGREGSLNRMLGCYVKCCRVAGYSKLTMMSLGLRASHTSSLDRAARADRPAGSRWMRRGSGVRAAASG